MGAVYFEKGVKEMSIYNKKGVPKGYTHDWHYKDNRFVETKIGPGTWKIYQGQSKHRNHSAPSGSGLPIGSELLWKFNTTQRMKKVDKDSYRGYMKGIKKLVKVKIPKYRAVKRKRLTKR